MVDCVKQHGPEDTRVFHLSVNGDFHGFLLEALETRAPADPALAEAVARLSRAADRDGVRLAAARAQEHLFLEDALAHAQE